MMIPSAAQPPLLSTPVGDVALQECRLQVGERQWAVLHTGAILTWADELYFLNELADHLPYGVALWPSAIALAHEVVTRPADFRGRTVLELGAGTGLPGIVAASLGGRVVQTDRQEAALAICQRNGERNEVGYVEYRLADWSAWDDAKRYDWVLGSDILYGEALHPSLRHIFENNLTPAGRILISDPFRDASLRLLEALEGDGWKVTMNKWTVGAEGEPRPIGVFELVPPALLMSPSFR